MTKADKLLKRLKSKPKDFTYEELVQILKYFGYIEFTIGKTTGSAKKFKNDKNDLINFHKPHPGNIMFNMKNDKFLKYKNYIGSVEYDLTDKCLFGKILFIDDLVTYEGNTIEDLENAFHEMVDDYLETCKEIGKEPQKAYSGSFNIRTSPEIHQALAEIAKMENVSLNKLIITIFNNFVEDSENKDNKLYSKILKNLSNS